MAGGFAHVLAARQALERLEDWAGLPGAAKYAMMTFQPHLEVGAVSPDYPYLMLPPGGQGAWADAMHYRTSAAPLRAGVAYVRALPEGLERARATAWLFGYAAHVATDLTIHPVVRGIVGDYDTHKTEHRICEMNQDAHIWARAGLGPIGAADVFAQAHRHVSEGRGLDPAVKGVWSAMLEEAYPDLWGQIRPDFDGWHSGYCTVVDAIDEARQLPAFGRHILEDLGAVHPLADEVDEAYVRDIPTPQGPSDYDAVFARAVEAIGGAWSDLGRALDGGADAPVVIAALPDANLDTGETEDGTLIMWRTA